MTEPAGGAPVARRDGSDPLTLLDGVPLSDEEDAYVRAARASNTLRGYRSDWGEFTAWCDQRSRPPLPAAAATITGYLTELARHGAKVGAMSRRCPRSSSRTSRGTSRTRPGTPRWSRCGRASTAPTAPARSRRPR